MSSLLTFGSAALWKVTQEEADAAIELAVEHGVNHFDVSPTYGQAEIRLGPWMEKHHKEIFLACKTRERSRTKAWEDLKRSLETLRVDHFDLYQFHGVDDLETLNVVLGLEGALEAVLEAKEQGLIKHIGITGHRPFVHVEALNRFDFDTVLFPLNRVLAAHRNDFNDFITLLEVARQKDVGTIAIKALAKRPWEAIIRMYRTWYEPFDEQTEMDKSLWYTLSQGVTTAAMPGDLRHRPRLRPGGPLRRDLRRRSAERRRVRRAVGLHERPLPERLLLRVGRLLRAGGRLSLVQRPAGLRRRRRLPGAPYRRDLRREPLRLAGGRGRPRLRRGHRGRRLRSLRRDPVRRVPVPAAADLRHGLRQRREL